jgi:MinD-like ATPase involved in chromosome partitioning or flagellar assembly
VNIVFVGAKASAITTSALAIAAAWPHGYGTAIFIEADPSGGDLAPRFDLPAGAGLASAASSLQRPTFTDLIAHTQTLPGGLRVVASPIPAAEVAGVLPEATRCVIAPLKGTAEGTLLIDAGRADGRMLPAVTTHADVVVLVVRQDARSAASTLARCLHARQLVQPLAARGIEPVALVVGDGPYRPTEIEAFLGVTVIGTLPEDPHGASHLAGRPAGRRSARRSRLAAAAAKVAVALATHLINVSVDQQTPSATHLDELAVR